jgi:hypothetical protein
VTSCLPINECLAAIESTGQFNNTLVRKKNEDVHGWSDGKEE